MVRVAGSTENMVPAMIEAVRVEATLGEICGALTELWGGYTEAPQF
jgi:methylmalonyl-CoA mutase N-terminal domain/subunit